METKKRKKTRIAKRCTIDLTTAAAAEVERIQRIFELSVADVFRCSLLLMSTYTDAISEGKVFSTIDPQNPEDYQILKLPVFTNVTKNNISSDSEKETKKYQ